MGDNIGREPVAPIKANVSHDAMSHIAWRRAITLQCHRPSRRPLFFLEQHFHERQPQGSDEEPATDSNQEGTQPHLEKACKVRLQSRGSEAED